jgi:hypothetical protein
MDLSTLRVLNVAKLSGRAAIEACGTVDQPAWNPADGFALETCQRRILVTTAARLARRAAVPRGGAEECGGRRVRDPCPAEERLE